jgi:hypothetical protein
MPLVAGLAVIMVIHSLTEPTIGAIERRFKGILMPSKPRLMDSNLSLSLIFYYIFP